MPYYALRSSDGASRPHPAPHRQEPRPPTGATPTRGSHTHPREPRPCSPHLPTTWRHVLGFGSPSDSSSVEPAPAAPGGKHALHLALFVPTRCDHVTNWRLISKYPGRSRYIGVNVCHPVWVAAAPPGQDRAPDRPESPTMAVPHLMRLNRQLRDCVLGGKQPRWRRSYPGRHLRNEDG